MELLNSCMGYTRSINCALVYGIRNVCHRWGVIINGTHELRSCRLLQSQHIRLQICIPDVTWRTLTGHAYISTWYQSNVGMALSNVVILLFVSISFWVLSFKRYKECVCFLKCSSAWDKKMGADEIRQKIKWHRAIWSPPEHWKLGWGFGVRGSAPYLSALRKNLFAQLFLRDC